MFSIVSPDSVPALVAVSKRSKAEKFVKLIGELVVGTVVKLDNEAIAMFEPVVNKDGEYKRNSQGAMVFKPRAELTVAYSEAKSPVRLNVLGVNAMIPSEPALPSGVLNYYGTVVARTMRPDLVKVEAADVQTQDGDLTETV